MKKVFKRLLLVLVCAITLGAFALAGTACGSSDDLTIKVTYPDGKAVAAEEVSVQVCIQMPNGTYGLCFNDIKTTDAKGVVTFSIAALDAAFDGTGSRTYKVQINKAPAGYKTHDSHPDYIAGVVNLDETQKITVKLEAV